jgi:hypothetical protein
MTKAPVKRRKKATKKIEIATSYSLSELYYGMETVKMQMQEMNDGELFDLCSHHIEMYNHVKLDALYPKLANGQKLTKKERNELEAFCILANTELCVEVK